MSEHTAQGNGHHNVVNTKVRAGRVSYGYWNFDLATGIGRPVADNVDYQSINQSVRFTLRNKTLQRDEQWLIDPTKAIAHRETIIPDSNRSSVMRETTDTIKPSFFRHPILRIAGWLNRPLMAALVVLGTIWYAATHILPAVVDFFTKGNMPFHIHVTLGEIGYFVLAAIIVLLLIERRGSNNSRSSRPRRR